MVLMYYWVSQKKFMHVAGCEIKSMGPIFKTEMLICQSKVTLNEKFCLKELSRYK